MNKTRFYLGKNREKTVELVEGDITKYEADALVCPANTDLEAMPFFGGVQGAFYKAAGAQPFMDAQKFGPVDHTDAVITGSGDLPIKHIVHSVAYAMKDGDGYADRAVIEESARKVLNLAQSKGLQSIGFPALGTGLWKCSLDDCLNGMADQFVKHFNQEESLQKIGVVLHNPQSYQKGQSILSKAFKK